MYLALNYKISCKKLESLCVSTEVDCGYELFVSILNINDLENPVFTENVDMAAIPCNVETDEKVIPISSIPPLPKGTYIVKKELRRDPSKIDYQEVLAKAEGQVKPITNWITQTLEKVNCIEKLNFFYHDLLFFSEEIAKITLPSQLEFDCSNCSNPTADNFYVFPTEFLTVHQRALEKDDPFEIKVLDRECNPVTHQDINDGTRRPHWVQIYSPCCNLQVDVSFKPPVRCLSPTELADFKTKFDNGTYKFEDLSPNPNYINNPDPFVDGDLKHHPIDFEGYTIGMIAQCKGISSNEASSELYSKMLGWHQPGVLNQMVFRMLTDNYTCSGTGNDDDSNPLNLEPCDLNGDNPGTDNTDPADGYDGECASSSQKRLYGTQYTCTELFNCWKGIINVYLQVECEGIELENNSDANDVTGATDEQGDGDHTNNTFDDVEIDGGWLVKWFAKKSIAKKMKEKSKKMDMKKTVKALRSHLVRQFLDCTGSRFADVISARSEKTFFFRISFK